MDKLSQLKAQVAMDINYVNRASVEEWDESERLLNDLKVAAHKLLTSSTTLLEEAEKYRKSFESKGAQYLGE